MILYQVWFILPAFGVYNCMLWTLSYTSEIQVLINKSDEFHNARPTKSTSTDCSSQFFKLMQSFPSNQKGFQYEYFNLRTGISGIISLWKRRRYTVVIGNLGIRYSSKNRGAGNYPTGRKLSLDIKFCYLAYAYAWFTLIIRFFKISQWW